MPKAKSHGLAKVNKAIWTIIFTILFFLSLFLYIWSRDTRKKQDVVTCNLTLCSVKLINHEAMGTSDGHIYRAEALELEDAMSLHACI